MKIFLKKEKNKMQIRGKIFIFRGVSYKLGKRGGNSHTYQK